MGVFPEARDAARRLRREGASIKEIARVVGASRSSVSGWVADIVLTAGQRAVLDGRVRANGGRADVYAARARTARAARAEAQQHGRRLAREASPLHQGGCMLSWAEGTKSRNTVVFTSSDADMVNRPSRASKGVRPQLVHGTARLAVSSTFIVQSIHGAIQEYAGCARPEWLDLGVKLPAPCPATA